MSAGRFDVRDDAPHPDARTEEWTFTTWSADGSIGVVSGYRVHRPGGMGWYWAALARRDEPLLHVTEWDVPARSDPLLVKAHGLWAEHVCDVPMEQWTVANETYATALDDPDDALGRAYGLPSAVAFDLEWYATAPPVPIGHGVGIVDGDGYEQAGVVHGLVEVAGGPLHLVEAPARRWHRWGAALAAVAVPDALAHAGVRAPFAFPDGTIADWVLTPDGWRSRAPVPAP